MATPYAKIYNSFLMKVTGYKLLELFPEEREEIIAYYLNAARAKFYKKCKHDLMDIDEENQVFNIDLTIDEVDILSEIMIVEWLSPQIYSDELLESRLNTKDFTEFSPAKLIEQIRSVYNESKKRVKYLIVQYTYDHGNVRDLDEE